MNTMRRKSYIIEQYKDGWISRHLAVICLRAIGCAVHEIDTLLDSEATQFGVQK